jgi:hypothetical protein
VSECGVSECGVSECDLEPSIMRTPWPTVGCCAMEKKCGLFINDPVSSTDCVAANLHTYSMEQSPS